MELVKPETEGKKEGQQDGVPVKPKYFDAESVGEIAKELINQYHPHLKDKPILYLFNDGNMRDWATMSKRNEREQFISGYLFVMEVNFKNWQVMTEEQRVALVDHELCHAQMEEGKPVIVDHDVEEFAVVVSRHGFWRENVRSFGHICADQLSLSFSRAVNLPSYGLQSTARLCYTDNAERVGMKILLLDGGNISEGIAQVLVPEGHDVSATNSHYGTARRGVKTLGFDKSYSNVIDEKWDLVVACNTSATKSGITEEFRDKGVPTIGAGVNGFKLEEKIVGRYVFSESVFKSPRWLPCAWKARAIADLKDGIFPNGVVVKFAETNRPHRTMVCRSS